jgi:hypothetical protein
MNRSMMFRLGVAAALVGVGIVSSQLAGACPSCQPSLGQSQTDCQGITAFGACTFQNVCSNSGEVASCFASGGNNASVWVDFPSSSPSSTVCVAADGEIVQTGGGINPTACYIEESTRGSSNATSVGACNSANIVVYDVRSCIG